MKHEFRKIEYNLATVTECIDKESGIVVAKTYEPYYRFTYVKEQLMAMCEQHDLRYSEYDKLPSTCVCSLKVFGSIKEFHDYVKGKANKEPYSYKIKGLFALVKIGKDKEQKSFIYKITNKLSL